MISQKDLRRKLRDARDSVETPDGMIWAVDEYQGVFLQRAKVYEQMTELMERQSDWTNEDREQWDKLDKRFDELTEKMAQVRRDAENIAGLDRLNGRMTAQPDNRAQVFRDSRGNMVRTKSWNESLHDDTSSRRDAATDISIERVLPAYLRNDYSGLNDAEQRALLGGTDDKGGLLLNTILGNQLYDLARPQSVVLRAGGQTLSMSESAMKLIRVTGDPTVHWRPELTAVNASVPTFDAVNLEPKTVACIVPISVELLEDASNMGTIIRQVIAARMGQAIDEAALKGAGVRDPLGLRNLGTLNAIGSVGTPTDYNHISNAVGDVMAANYPGSISDLAWVSHPRDDDVIDQLADSTGQPLQPTPRVSQVQRFSTTSIATNEGGGSNESYAVVGDFSQVIVAMRTNLQVRVTADGIASDGTTDLNATSQLARLFIAYMRLDVAVVRPTWLTLLTGITSS